MYAFLAEETSFNFSKEDLTNLRNRSQFPTVLDWSIGNLKCEEAKKDSESYLCAGKSEGEDPENGEGYRCKCLPGYKGNPYMPNGCHGKNHDTIIHQFCKSIIDTFARSNRTVIIIYKIRPWFLSRLANPETPPNVLSIRQSY